MTFLQLTSSEPLAGEAPKPGIVGKIKASLEDVTAASKASAIGSSSVPRDAPAVKSGGVNVSVSAPTKGGVGVPTVPGGGVDAPKGSLNVGGGKLLLFGGLFDVTDTRRVTITKILITIFFLVRKFQGNFAIFYQSVYNNKVIF